MAARYTEQIVIMVTPEMKAEVIASAAAEDRSVSALIRRWLELGKMADKSKAVRITAARKA